MVFFVLYKKLLQKYLFSKSWKLEVHSLYLRLTNQKTNWKAPQCSTLFVGY